MAKRELNYMSRLSSHFRNSSIAIFDAKRLDFYCENVEYFIDKERQLKGKTTNDYLIIKCNAMQKRRGSLS